MKKKILITGSGSGLGRDAAFELCKRGHQVYATCHYAEQAAELNLIAKEQSLSMEAFKLDVLEDMDLALVHKYEIDVLINNAAIGQTGSVAETPLEIYHKVFNTNFFATIAITQEVLKDMIERKSGRVIFISSLEGRIAMPFFSPYGATKHAIEAVAVSLKRELKMLKQRGIKIDVAIIEPGAYATGFNQQMIESKFAWMTENSFFRGMLTDLRQREHDFFCKIEQESNASIIQEYINACEAKRVKMRYSAPKSQAIATQLKRAMGK